MSFWDFFKTGLAFRAGVEAGGFIPRLLRGFFRCVLYLFAVIVVLAVLKTLWWLVLAIILAYAAWRWGKKRKEYERNV